jgi:hypothetical protein
LINHFLYVQAMKTSSSPIANSWSITVSLMALLI